MLSTLSRAFAAPASNSVATLAEQRVSDETMPHHQALVAICTALEAQLASTQVGERQAETDLHNEELVTKEELDGSACRTSTARHSLMSPRSLKQDNIDSPGSRASPYDLTEDDEDRELDHIIADVMRPAGVAIDYIGSFDRAAHGVWGTAEIPKRMAILVRKAMHSLRRQVGANFLATIRSSFKCISTQATSAHTFWTLQHPSVFACKTCHNRPTSMY